MQLLRFLLAAFVVIAVQAFAVSPEATEKSEKRAQDAEHNPETATLGVSSYCLTTNVQDTCVRIFRHATVIPTLRCGLAHWSMAQSTVSVCTVAATRLCLITCVPSPLHAYLEACH